MQDASNENTVVAPAAPTIATVATPNFVLGAGAAVGQRDGQRLVNPVSAQDEVVFRLYRGVDCTDANLILTRTDTTLTYNAPPTEGAADSGAPFIRPGAGRLAGGRSTAATTTTSRWRARATPRMRTPSWRLPRRRSRRSRRRTSCSVPASCRTTRRSAASSEADRGAGARSCSASIAARIARTRTYPHPHRRVADHDAPPTQGAADSGAPFTPPGAGTYRWRAFYSGDDNNVAVAASATRRTRTPSSRRRRRRSRRSHRRTSSWAQAG